MLAEFNVIAFLATGNAERCKTFYRDVLQLQFISEDRFALEFKIKETILRIQKVKNVSAPEYTALGWGVLNISREVEDLTKRGVTFSHYKWMKQDKNGIWTSPSGARVAWFEDPDHHVLSITQITQD